METLRVLGIDFFGISLGFIVIWGTYKTWANAKLGTSFKGYSAGILSILLGILYMLRNLHIINW